MHGKGIRAMRAGVIAGILALAVVAAVPAGADETCNSPYMGNLIKGQEDYLYVWAFMDGKTRYFDLSNPEQPKQTYERVTGKQVNMVSQSWDGTRVYIASSLLANWDKGGADDEQFVRGFAWDGKELKPTFEVDFYKEKLGRAHHMKLGSKAMKAAYGLERTATLR
jgi:hypothetical protein